MNEKPKKRYKTPRYRVSFPQLVTAVPYKDGKPKFEVTMLFSISDLKADPEQLALFNAIREAIVEAIKGEWGDHPPRGLKLPMRKGVEKDHIAGYTADIVFAATRTTRRPGVVYHDPKVAVNPATIVAGDYAHSMIDVYAWRNREKHSNGVSLGLVSIQKLSDGEPFAAASKPEDDYDTIQPVEGDFERWTTSEPIATVETPQSVGQEHEPGGPESPMGNQSQGLDDLLN